nr:DoxX family protein [Streptomyces sp. alain-838]
MLRLALGGTMIAHGVKHGRTLEGTTGWFRSLGFRKPKLQAAASATVEMAAGGGARPRRGHPRGGRRGGRHDGRRRARRPPRQRVLRERRRI